MHFESVMMLFDHYRPRLTSLGIAFVAWFAIVAWLAIFIAPSCQAEITDQQRAKATELAEDVLAAGKLYADGSYEESAEQVASIQQELVELLRASDAELQGLVKPSYQRLVRAHGLLELEGAELEPLPNWRELTAGDSTAAGKMPNTANSSTASSAATTMKVERASGDETISYAGAIAPILLANCQGCHIGGNQTSGGLRMDSFAQLLRGGDSGSIIEPGKSSESLLVKKIKGESGDRMPAGGRPALSAEQIAAVATWVDEGATFDGPTADMNIETVINQVWADSAGHDELFQRRQQNALQRWTRVLPNDSPTTASNDELFVLGNVPQEQLDKTLEQLQAAASQTKKLLKAPADKPLIKGGLSVFVLKSRYDYSEFGRMTEGRELPREWLGHWHADPLDVYGALAADSSSSAARATDKQAEAIALQIVSGAYLGSFSQVPTWFAEGIARNLVQNSFRRGDARLAAWQQAYPDALLKVDQAKTLLEGRLDQEAAGLVGMGLTNFMMERNNRRRFDQLLELLRAGKTFESACTATFATPEALVTGWLGK